MSSYKLAVCAEMVFRDLPFIERVQKLHDLGFAIGLWHWKDKNLNELRDSHADFVIMNGYLSGNLTDKKEINQLLESIEVSVEAANILNVKAMNIHGTGLDANGLPIKSVEVVTSEMWLTAYDTLQKVAKLGEKHQHIISLENLNTNVDHPGVPFASAHDTYALVKAVNSPYLKLNLDLYHAQVDDGNLIELIKKCFGHINEIQIADVPGRMQPGTGEINWRNIALTINELGFDRYVTMEAWNSGNSLEAVSKFKKIFTI